MNLNSLNNRLQKLEYKYADNEISLLKYHRCKEEVLSSIEDNEDLSYDEEKNIIYRISVIPRHKLSNYKYNY